MFSLTGPLFAQALTLTLADSSELRARYETESTSARDEGIAWDANTTPSATLALDNHRASYTLRYGPSFTAFDIGTDSSETTQQHNVIVAGTWRFPDTTVSLTESLAYGRQNTRLAFVGPTDSTPGGDDEPPELEPDEPEQVLPGQEGTVDRIVTTGTSVTTLGLAHSLSRTVTLSEYASYTFSSGLDGSEDLYPRQRGGLVGVSVGYSLTRRQSLATILNGSVVYTDPLPSSVTGEEIRSTTAALQETWSCEWIRDLQTTLGVGLTYSRTDEGDLVDESLNLVIGPVGSMSATYNWGYGGASYALTGAVGLSPYVDRFTGIVDPRVFYSAGLERVQGKLTLRAIVAGAQSAQTEDLSLSTATATFTAEYQLAETLVLRSGISASTNVELAEDVLPQETAPPLYYAFIGFTYSALPFKL